MRDLVFVAVIIGFFAVAALYVRACAKITGPDDLAPAPAFDDDETVEVGTGAR
jgi:hypothetical protein